MIKLIPSISVYDNKCVRLIKGNYNKKIEYGEQPLTIAQRFEEHGIDEIHLIDLNGSQVGKGINFDVLQVIAGHTGLAINYGGGINTDGGISKAFEYGATMATIGSMAYDKQELFASWVISYGRDKVCLSADALNGKIQVTGWQKATEIDLFDHIDYYYNRSIKYVKCSDVDRDGALGGPNFELYKSLMEKFPELKIMASGGVSSIDDLKKLNDIGLYGVIFGRAYYENRISLTEIERFMANVSEV